MSDTTTTPAPAAPFDFGGAGDTTRHTFVPTHPGTGEPLPGVEFYLAGEDTEEFRRATTYAARRMAERARRKRPDALGIVYQIEQLARVIVGWKGVAFNGAELPYSPANAEMLLRERQWVLEQVSAFIGDREARLGKSESGSPG